MYVSEEMTDDQPLMRYLTHGKLLRLLNAQPALDVWSYLDPPPKGKTVWNVPPPREYGALWMALPNSFGDKGEGTFPALNANDDSFCDLAARHLGLSPEDAVARKREFLVRNPVAIREGIRARAQLCGVSCWYQDSQESKIMWSDYVPDSRGVVVKTTLKNFEEAILFTTAQYKPKDRPKFVTANYVDRHDYFLLNDGYYDLLSIKDKGFKDEREVRLLAKSPDFLRATADYANPSLDEITNLAASAGKGFNVLIDLKRLVTEIRVHPSMKVDYLGLIQKEIEMKGMSPEIVKPSELPAW